SVRECGVPNRWSRWWGGGLRHRTHGLGAWCELRCERVLGPVGPGGGVARVPIVSARCEQSALPNREAGHRITSVRRRFSTSSRVKAHDVRDALVGFPNPLCRRLAPSRCPWG